MKKLVVFATVIFFLGLLLKLFHIHYNAVIMLIGLLLMLVANIALLIGRDSGFNGWLGIASTCWLTLLLFTIKFYPFSDAVLTIAIIFSLAGVVTGLKRKDWKQLASLTLNLLLALGFYFTPSDSKYHLFNIRWNYEVATDFFSWDKYSWFLYKNQKYHEALEASAKALEIANQQNELEWSEMIKEHQEKIQARNWTTFR